MAEKPGRVSVVIPTYNSAKTIRNTLNSIVAQTFRPYEVIVIDDCSTDETCDIVNGDWPIPVRLIKQPQNGGPSRSRNTGIAAARGDFLAFLDSDDIWYPEKLALQMAVFSANPNLVMVACYFRRVDQAGRRISDPMSVPEMEQDQVWKFLLLSSLIQTSTVVASLRSLKELDGFDENLVVAEDQDLWIRLALSGNVAWVKQELVDFVASQGSFMTQNSHRQMIDLVPMIERHVQEQGTRLSRRERNHILGKRYAVLGRSIYQSGQYILGAKYIFKALARGYEPIPHILFLLSASPIGSALKKFLRKS